MSFIKEQVVERVGPKGNSLMINNTWYSSFKAASLTGAKEGDVVSFEYIEKESDDPMRPYRNIKGNVQVVGVGSAPTSTVGATSGAVSGGKAAFPIAKDNYQRSIIRQNAVTSAINFSAGEKTLKEVFAIAKQIERYTAGDEDAEAMKKLAEEVSA